MGLGRTELLFELGIPDFSEIKSAFHKQTGLDLWIAADINLLKLATEPSEILNLLKQSEESVCEIRTAYAAFQQADSHGYEVCAAYRDNVFVKQMNQLNYFSNVRFKILGFYELDFYLNENALTIEHTHNNYYALISLIKVLEALGGRNTYWDGVYSKSLEKYKRLGERRSQKLKPWHEYKWYNRPRK